jgi:FkbM family methyltransferase
MTPFFGAMLLLLRARAAIMRPLRVEAVMTDGNRLMCELPDLIPLYVYTFGIWEPDVDAFIRSRLGAGDVFVDVGANIGYDTLLASRAVGPSGAVTAIEASPAVFELLQDALQRNGAPKHVRLLNAAASHQAGTLNLYAGPSTNVGLTTTVPRAGMPKVAEVAAHPLADLLTPEEIARAKLIKIDVEGGEPAVLAGLLGAADRLLPEVEIVIELSPAWWADRSATAASVLRPWVERGFHVYAIKNTYWPWRYLWPNHVDRPERISDPMSLTRRVKRLDVVLSRVDAQRL